MGKEEKRKEGSKSTPRSKCRNSSSSSSKQMCTSCMVEGRSMFFLLCLDPLFLSHSLCLSFFARAFVPFYLNSLGLVWMNILCLPCLPCLPASRLPCRAREERGPILIHSKSGFLAPFHTLFKTCILSLSSSLLLF